MKSPAIERVLHAVDAALAAWRSSAHGKAAGTAGAPRIAVALSGGRDSMALLDALATLAPERGVSVAAVHVHHGLSPNADAWAEFCAVECTARSVPLAVHRIRVERAPGASLEAAARAARHRAFAIVDADAVALAHHADDQAETLLLQLLRGAGPHGLAAMPAQRRTGAAPALVRPFLALPRAAIDAYVAARGVAWVDDESNANMAFTRNLLRHDFAPRLAAAFPGYPATLVRAAAHQAEAAQLIDELAALDAQCMVAIDEHAGTTLDRAALIAWAEHAPHRAKNLLRWFLRQHDLRAPSAARLTAMLDQLVRAAPDARVRIAHGDVELGIHRGRIVVHPAAVGPFVIRWQGEASLALPHGTLEFAPAPGVGVAAAALAAAQVTVRARAGGERIRLAGDRPRQMLKRLLQDAGMPIWRRDALPLVWCGETLAAVPGIGVDAAFQALAGAPGYEIRWHPSAP